MRTWLSALLAAILLLPASSRGEVSSDPNPILPYRPVRIDFHPQLPPCSLLIDNLRGLPPLELHIKIVDEKTGRQPLQEQLLRTALSSLLDSAGIPVRTRGYWFEERAFLVIECYYALEPAPGERHGMFSELGFLFIFAEVLRAFPLYQEPWQYVTQRAWCTQQHGPIPSRYVTDVLQDYVIDCTRDLAGFCHQARALEGQVPLAHGRVRPVIQDSATAGPISD